MSDVEEGSQGSDRLVAHKRLDVADSRGRHGGGLKRNAGDVQSREMPTVSKPRLDPLRTFFSKRTSAGRTHSISSGSSSESRMTHPTFPRCAHPG